MRFLFSIQGRLGRPSVFFIAALLLSACSVYRSEGRKFLEKEAFEYAGVEAFREECHNSTESAGLSVIQADARATVFALDSRDPSPNRIRVLALGDRPYSCDYGFTTQEQMTSNISHAIDQTVDRMHAGAN